eukprot:1604570-Rhodomonas_salina.1
MFGGYERCSTSSRVNFGNPKILTDIRLTLTKSQQVTQMLLNLWCYVPITARIAQADVDAESDLGEHIEGNSAVPPADKPFNDAPCNEVWRVFASQMIEGYKELADIDMLEPDQPHSAAAMKNIQLRPFWMVSENKEMEGLNAK